MSGLKVNFQKSLLVGVNINDSWLNKAATVLDCKIGRVSFMYLGLSIGGDAHRCLFGIRLWQELNLDCLNGRVTLYCLVAS